MKPDFIPNVPVLTVVKLDVDEPLNFSHPLPGYNFEELFVVVGQFPSDMQGNGNAHYLLYRWHANGTNKIGMMHGQVELYRFVQVDPDEDM